MVAGFSLIYWCKWIYIAKEVSVAPDFSSSELS